MIPPVNTYQIEEERFSVKAKNFCRKIAIATGIGSITTAIFSAFLLTSDQPSRRAQGERWANVFIAFEALLIVSLVALAIFTIISMMS